MEDGPPPPPPPPHGENPRTKKSGGLPDGKYDIFVIPPSSAGSGFLYLPSLNTQRNSFLAGCACTATAFFFYSVALPVVKEWFHSTIHGGGSGILMLILGVGVVSWALGKTQGEGIGSMPSAGNYFKGTNTPNDESAHGKRRPPPPQAEHEWDAPPPRNSRPPPPPREPTPPPSPPPPPPQESGPAPPEPKKESEPSPESKETPSEPTMQSPPQKPKSSWQRASQNPDAKSAWEKAREETRRREEERKRAAEIQRRREELLKERERLREKETVERLEREWKENKAREDEAAKKAEAELKAKQAKEEAERRIQREKERREREAREALLRAAKEAREAKEALEKARREEQERKEQEEKEAKQRQETQQKEAQKAAEEERVRHDAEIRAAQIRAAEMRAEDAERARATAEARAAEAARGSNVSSNASKKPPRPSARTEKDDDAYSFRPYDRPRGQKSSSGSVYSEDSYAPSASTARTTPPASTRGPYTTKDPDKVIIKGVYSFNNAFMRTPISQLISGQGNVTDGLILRITTEGLFIDDDVRGVPQREWDVKAWTLKLCESVELQGHLILRASLRDQEGKKYVFVLSQTEGWKVAVGLQRLRKGSQVRALGVAGMPVNEARVLLESLGWA